MNYYKRHLGDYAKKAGHLSPLEHGVYTLILDSYYDREQGPTLMEATRWARARTEEEKSAVLAVLDEFFTLGPDERYTQNRVEEELATYRAQAEVNRGIALAREQKKRERKDQASSTNRAPSVDEAKQDREPSHKPLAISHKPIEEPIGASAPSGTVIERRQATLDAIEEALPIEVAEVEASKAARQEYPADFEAAWALYPARYGGNPKKESFKHWNARRREGVPAEDMRAGVERYAAYCAAAGKVGTEFVMQGPTFFGTSKRYAEQWPTVRPNATVPNRANQASTKFHFSDLDYASSVAAAEQSRARMGVNLSNIDENDPINF